MSHHRFSVLAFKAIIASQFRRSESSFTVLRSESSSIFRRSELHLQFDVQSHHLFLVDIQSCHHLSTVGRLEPSFTFRRLETSPLHSLAFRVVIFLPFGVQSHFSSALSFRVVIPAQFGVQSHCLFHSLAFRVIILSWLGIHRHIFGV